MITPHELVGLAIMLSLCVVGWKLGERLRLPAAPILGSLIMISVASALSVNLYLPGILRQASSIGIGITIGCRFNLKLSRGMILNLLIFIGFVLLASLLLGFVLMAFGIDTNTAMFAGMLGGITEISLIALEFEAITYQVSIFHTVRMITLMLIIPMIAKRLTPPAIESEKAQDAGANKKDWIFISIVSIAVGMLAGSLGIPAGRMVGAMAVTAIYSKRKNISPKMNKTMHNLLQCIVGGAIGLGVTYDSIVHMKDLIIPLLVANALVFLECIFHSWIMCRIAKWDKLTSLLACTPGGLSPCVLMSVEMGADSSTVTMYQVIRYISVILFAVVLAVFKVN